MRYFSRALSRFFWDECNLWNADLLAEGVNALSINCVGQVNIKLVFDSKVSVLGELFHRLNLFDEIFSCRRLQTCTFLFCLFLSPKIAHLYRIANNLVHRLFCELLHAIIVRLNFALVNLTATKVIRLAVHRQRILQFLLDLIRLRKHF